MLSKFRRLIAQSKADYPAKPTPPPPPESQAKPAAPPPAEPSSTGESPTRPSTPPVHPEEFTEPLSPRPSGSARQQAEAYLARLKEKTNRLAEDFAAGTINRAQFQKLYEHYQRERKTLEEMLSWPSPTEEVLKGAMAAGASVLIRKENLSRAQGYSIYENESGMPLTTIGHFELDPVLVVPMLSSFRAATKEIFGAGMRSTAIEGGKWLCFVPGEFTTTLAVFNTEPAPKQLEYLEGLHRLFEQANRHRLTKPPISPDSLLFPHEFFAGL